MDLPLFLNVLARHKIVVAVGASLAVALAVLSYAHPAIQHGRPTLHYRQQEQWESTSRVLLSVPARPVRSALAQDQDEARLPSLAVLYAGLATGDGVRRLVLKRGAIVGKIVAAAETATGGTATLPIVEITAVAPSPSGSRQLANRYASALIRYVTGEQASASVPAEQRVAVGVLNWGGQTKIAVPRKKTLPIIAFLALMSATVGAAFVLENLQTRPSARAESEPGPPVDGAIGVTRVPPVADVESEVSSESSGSTESLRRWA